MPQAMLKTREEEEEEQKESRRCAPVSEVRIEQVRLFLSDAEGQKFDSLPPKLQKAIAAAGAKYGAEEAGKLVDAVHAALETKSSGRKKDNAEKAMDGLKEIASSPKATEEIREISHFAWSYYNEELGKEEVVNAQAETMRNEFEGEFDEGKKKGTRGEDDERPMALKVGHHGASRAENVQQLLIREENLVVEQQERARVLESTGQEGKRQRPRRARYENESVVAAVPKLAKGAGAPGEGISDVQRKEKELAEAAVKKIAQAAADEKLTPILEFVVVKGTEKDAAKKEMELLEIDEKKLEVAKRQLELQMGRAKEQISLLEKMKSDDKKAKEKKLRLLRKKLAFWNKAHGALRRLAGGMFGSMAKMLGGIFR